MKEWRDIDEENVISLINGRDEGEKLEFSIDMLKRVIDLHNTLLREYTELREQNAIFWKYIEKENDSLMATLKETVENFIKKTKGLNNEKI